MDNIVSAKLDSRYASTLGVWQYDYGQVLRITGPELPLAVEVQFSLDEKSGETLSRVGTTVDGVTEVKIPDELLTHSATSNTWRMFSRTLPGLSKLSVRAWASAIIKNSFSNLPLFCRMTRLRREPT